MHNFIPSIIETFKSNIPTFQEQMAKLNQPYTAKNIFNQLVQRIKAFEETLDQEHEVGMQLVSFGQKTQFSVCRIGYLDPSLIWFDGVLADGSNVQLVQHVNQISFLMMAVKRQNPDQPKCPIGFCYPSQQTESESEESNSTSDQVAATKD